MKTATITIRGARQHNLKEVDVDIPRNKLVVITGLSGSGKSTLAFDTLYAEGQRRYVESLSAYARHFLERLEKPDVDLIEGLSPAIAIEQKTASHNPRSTVGTVTEVYDYLRLLFAKLGKPHCHQCGQPITSQSVDQIADKVMQLTPGTRIMILAPLINKKKGTHTNLLSQLKKEGFARVRVDGEIIDIESARKLEKNIAHSIEVVVDRLVVKANIIKRLSESIELALSRSEGLVATLIPGESPTLFSESMACIDCGVSYPQFCPASFSFNSPQGACPECNGLGSAAKFDPERIVPNPQLSLREGAIAPWAGRSSVHFNEFLDALSAHCKSDIYTPYKNLVPEFKTILMHGSGDEKINFYFERDGRRHLFPKPFEGLIPQLKRRYLETESSQSREEIKRYMTFKPCPHCRGSKLNPASNAVKFKKFPIHSIAAMSVAKAHRFFNDIMLSGKEKAIAQGIIKEITYRLGFLEKVGLPYLTLDRSAQTLSGGESQRIRLATQIGSKLSGVLYVLDEPSIGLHQRDNQRLLETLISMRDLENTVLVVEHDEETILNCDHIIDMGPGAGIKGGEVVYSGPPELISSAQNSLTAQYMSGQKKITVPSKRRRGSGNQLIIEGASANNLKCITVAFPLGCLICVTGVSGSGKSTLVLATLYRVLSQRLYRSRIPAAKHTGIRGLQHIDKVIHIDQSPIGKTPRSNPGTYTGIFTDIRELFSKTADARMRGYLPGRFSFNVKGGRCETCRGDGIIRIEMHFLPDVYVTCDICKGKRYNRETLDIRYKGKNIAEVLDMTVAQALSFFRHIRTISSKLEMLAEVGLSYIHIGQPATTLSGGEAQRVKLARELGRQSTGRTIYILDEPTTGLHLEDISKLLQVLSRLVDSGNTVIVIEHHMDVIKYADHVIDMGPEGGDQGGYVVAEGTPEAITKISASYTGLFLKPKLSL